MADLKNELTTDELGWGYNGPGVFNAGPGPMTDQEVADILNTVHPSPDTRTRNRTSMTGDELFQATDPAEFVALPTGSGNTADDQGHWLAFCGRAEIAPFATANVQLVIAIFGVSSATVVNLNAARVESITRAVELGLPLLKGKLLVGYVTAARAV